MAFKFLNASQAGNTITCASGTQYVVDKFGVLTVATAAYTDIQNIINAGFVSLGVSGAISNFTATTAPLPSNDNTQDYAVGSRWLNVASGIEYICYGAATGAAMWAASASDLPFVAGRFYSGVPGATLASVLTVLGTLYAYPIYIPSKITLATLNLSVGTGQTGGKGRGALFYDNGAGYPGAIVPGSDSGDLAGTATAVVASSALALPLPPGVYWVASIFSASSTMPSVIGATATYSNIDTTILGASTAANALATSAQAATGLALTGQTYPATNMATSFPNFPASAALAVNVTTPILALGV